MIGSAVFLLELLQALQIPQGIISIMIMDYVGSKLAIVLAMIILTTVP